MSRLRCQRGFSLIEMLVAMVGGIAVVGALFTIMDVTLHQTTRTFTRVDATQRARVVLETLMNELHSSCTSYGATPVQSSSSSTSLIFTTVFGTAASPTTVQHTIAFSSSAGTLTDTTSSGTTTLLSNVAQSGSTPVFQYFAYQVPTNSSGQAYTDGAGNSYEMLLDGTSPIPGTSTIPTASPLSTPLSATGAASTVEVLITLKVGAAGGTSENTGLTASQDTVSDSAVLRLTPAANHAGSGTSFSPCE